MKRRATVVVGTAVALVTAVVTAPSALAAAPTITSFSPSSGPLNSAVVVHGTNLSGATGATLDGVNATISSNTATAVTVRVPPTAGSGPITVTTPRGTATSSTSFTVSPGVFVAAAAAPGTSLTVTGSGFSSFEAVDVYLDTTDSALATTTQAGAFTATVAVPASTPPGTHWISAVGRHSGYSAQKSFAVRTNWPTFAGDPARQDTDQTENVLNQNTVSDLDESWVFTANGGMHGIVESGGIVYGSSYSGTVYAIDATTGAQKWSLSLGSNVLDTPAVSGGYVYLGDAAGAMLAINATTGAVQWTVPLSGNVGASSPAVVGGLVYVGTSSGVVYALNATTGATVWTFDTLGGPISSPAVAGQIVYAEDGQDDVYALDAASGTQDWQKGYGGDAPGSVSFSAGRLFFPFENQYVASLNAYDGATLWESQDTGAAVESTFAVHGNVVYAANDQCDVFAYDTRTGGTYYNNGTFTLPVANGSCSSNLVLAGGMLFLGTSQGTLLALAANSAAVLWQHTLPAAISSIIVTDGTLTVATGDGRVYRYSTDPSATGAVHAPRTADLHPGRAQAGSTS